jgi:predicted LPLAT superfamily acyltransferase
VVERVEAWGGKVPFDRIHFQGDDIGELITTLERKEGAVLIFSHLGNMELLRGLANFNRTGVNREVPVTSIINFRLAAYFNRMLGELNPSSTLRLVNSSEIGPDTISLLQERIAQGELVVIAGDRTSEHVRDRCFYFPFLGEQAPFGYGAFFLAALLKAPVYFVFALRRGDLSLKPDYDMHVRRLDTGRGAAGRRERRAAAENMARRFAALLEGHCLQHPYQWYNFYDFWAEDPDTDESAFGTG